METNRIYIGKGKQVQDFDMVEVSINLEAAEAQIFEYEGKRYLKFTVARMKQPDKFDKTHTAYIDEIVKKDAPAEKPKRKRRAAKK